MSTALRVVLVGCGRMGTTIDDEVRGRPGEPVLPYSHAAAIVAARGVELVAVSDVMADKVAAAQKRYDVPRGYDDYRTMIETEKPDIVSIATRPATHKEIVLYAAEHGVRGIYCEKPLCDSMAEADAMVDACRAHGVQFNYGTQRRYTPIYQEVRALLARGDLGKVDSVVGFCGVGAALWSHTHATDMLLYLAGDPEIDFVQGSVLVDDADFADNRIETDPGVAMGYVRFKNGVHGYLVAGGGWEFEVGGSKGKIRVLANGSGVAWRRPSERGGFEPADFPEAPVVSGTVRGFEDLAQAIRTGCETQGGIELARRSQEMVMAMVESQRQGGRRIALPMENRSLYVGRADW